MFHCQRSLPHPTPGCRTHIGTMGQEQKWETLNIIWEGEDGETGRNKCPHLPLKGARIGLCFPGRWEGPPLDPIRHPSPESQARAHESGQGSNPGSAHAAECSLGLASPATILGLNCLLWKRGAPGWLQGGENTELAVYSTPNKPHTSCHCIIIGTTWRAT